MKITDDEIKRVCSPTIYKRGLEYYKDGRVHIKSREENSITALVDGEDVYNIRINFDGDKITSCICTCPYYQTMGSNCKHIAATLKKRQGELLEGENYRDENDRIAKTLCNEFAQNCFEKRRLMIKFIFNIISTEERKCRYSVELLCGFDELRPISGIDRFLECYINNEDFKISKHQAINSATYSVGENEEKILKILCEAYQNKLSGGMYINRVSQTYIAPSSAGRIFPLLQFVDCDYYFNSLPMSEYSFMEDNPDILIDVNATDSEISLNIFESGTALFDDGSWFLYENCFYHTDEEWRSWFMPIYKSLLSESRTQIDFKGSSKIDFATYVYPKIRNKRGVVTAGIDAIVINEKPEFLVYLDMVKNVLTAKVNAKYGTITLALPSDKAGGEKIVIRDILAEEQLLSFFLSFSLEDNQYSTKDNSIIYEFISDSVPKLSQIADVYMSESVEKLKLRDDVPLKTRVNYKKDIDLLEISFETELKDEDIYGILSAIRLKEKFYRLSDGGFVALDDNIEKKFKLFDSLNFSQKDITAGEKVVSKYHTLYLEALEREGRISGDDAFCELITKIKKIKAKIPDGLKSILRNYQKDGVNWLKQLSELGFGGILADDMGLGKTLEVISFVASEKKQAPSLVVCPSSLTYNWYNEIKRFAPFMSAVIVDGIKEEREEALKNLDGHDFVITSYPLIRRDIDMYADLEFSYMFIDESQHIKNPDTMSAKAVKKIKAGCKFALSGTPVENSLTELWSVFDFVMKGYLNTRKDFASRYDRLDAQENAEELSELEKKIRPFVLRRMKKDVLSELPDKIENTIFCDFVPEQKKVYEAFHAIAKKEVLELLDDKGSGMQILTLLLRLRQICCHPSLFDENYKKDSAKLILLEDIVTSAISHGHRILIFSQFTSMLDIIRKRLKNSGFDCFFIDGKTPSVMRTQLCEKFNEGEKKIFLISLKAGGTGLNLTGADTVIHYDPWWNPAVMDQATDRAYRIGQNKSVQVIRLATRGTIEEQILKLAEKKKELAESVIKKNTKTVSKLSREEILALFE